VARPPGKLQPRLDRALLKRGCIMANDESKPTGKWIMRLPVDDVLASTTTLTRGAFRLLIALEGYCRTKPRCWPKNAKLALATGLKQRAVIYGLKELETAGWIERRAETAMESVRTGIAMLRRLDPNLPVETKQGACTAVQGGDAPECTGGHAPQCRGGHAPECTQNKDTALNKDEVGNKDASEERNTFRSRKHRSSTTDVRSAGRSAARPKSKRTNPDRMAAKEMDAAIRHEAATQTAPRPVQSADAPPIADEPF
jgi:hypothetical protein